MTTTTKREAMLDRIEKHGRNLLAIFPNATERDPVKLCKRLRRLELLANKAALDLCNIPNYQEKADSIFEKVSESVTELLRNVEHSNTPNVYINRDPRGYALKITSGYVRTFELAIHTDMGGDGIIAPDLTEGN